MPLHRMRETTVPNGPEGRPKIRIPNNWAPRRYQRNVWRYLEQGGKRAICIWHRRAGKDEVCLHWAAASMIDRHHGSALLNEGGSAKAVLDRLGVPRLRPRRPSPSYL